MHAGLCCSLTVDDGDLCLGGHDGDCVCGSVCVVYARLGISIRCDAGGRRRAAPDLDGPLAPLGTLPRVRTGLPNMENMTEQQQYTYYSETEEQGYSAECLLIVMISTTDWLWYSTAMCKVDRLRVPAARQTLSYYSAGAAGQRRRGLGGDRAHATWHIGGRRSRCVHADEGSNV